MQGISPAVFTDSYKLSHKGFMEPGTEVIYSNATARSDKHFVARNLKGYDGKAVVFGLQYFIKDFLIDYWNINFFSQPKEKAIGKFKRIIDAYLGPGAVSMQHFEQLHDLGYLPIRIKSLPEGSRVNMRVPYSTIRNTHKDFAWLTNYLESVWSCDTWKPMTTATICYYIRKALNEAAMKTTGSLEGTQFQMHGFEFRGMSGRQDAMVNAAAMLLSTNGTDMAYSARNRSASIRIPYVQSDKARRIEVRFPDPMANSYLAFAAMLMAGLDGVPKHQKPTQV